MLINSDRLTGRPLGAPPSKSYIQQKRRSSSLSEPDDAPTFAGGGSGLRNLNGGSPNGSSSSKYEPLDPEDDFSSMGGGLVRAYTVWPTNNTFCCWGFCMTGPSEDTSPNMCAWLLVLVPMATFLALWGDVLHAASLPTLYAILACFASTIVWFLATSFTDPGILARNPDPRAHEQPQPSLYKQVKEADGTTTTHTWCSTCYIYRPPRASHCNDCGNCVRDFDHHCPFTRNCIGGRNYPFFLLFLISVSLSLGALMLACIILGNEPPPRTSLLGSDPELGQFLNMLLILFAVFLSLIMWGFTGYHVSLVFSGHTTKEHLRGRKHGAKRLDACERICLPCCGLTPSELEPRQLVPRNGPHVGGGAVIPTIRHDQL